MFFSETGVRLKCYDVSETKRNEKDNEDFYQSKALANAFGPHYGSKFDGRGHTWLFF